MADAVENARHLADTVTVAREFMGGEAHKSLVDMLTALENAYKEELIDVRPEGLVRLQSCIQQVRAIKDTLTPDRSYVSPKI